MVFKLLTMVVVCLAGVASGENVYRRSLERVASMDPTQAAAIYSARAVQMVYEPLLDIDYKARPYKLIPNLVVALPACSEDNLSYTFELDPEARFQADECFPNGEGRAVTSEDVVYSLKRMADAKVASPGAWLVEDVIKGMKKFHEASSGGGKTDYDMKVEGLEVLGERRFRITLERYTHQFLWYLAMAYTAIVPREAVEKYGAEFGSHAVGTGPYKLLKWRRNHEMLFGIDHSWRGWRRGPAALDGVDVPFDKFSFRVMDDVSTQWLCFLSGEVDFLGEISRDNWDVVIDGQGGLSPELEKRGFRLHSIPALEVAYVGINMDDPLLGKNKKLRQALNAAFDQTAWAKFLNGRVSACNSPVPPGTEGRVEAPLAYSSDLALARKLLEEAGYKNGIDPATGNRLELELDIGQTSQDVRESTELMVSFYAKVGINIVPQYHNWPTFLKRISQRQSKMFRIGWVGDYPDAENFLQLFYSKNVAPGPNRCNYSNAAFDAIYEKACATVDERERNKLWIEAQEILREDCPWIYLHFRKAYSVCGPRVKYYKASDFPFGTEKYLRVGP